VYEVDSSLDARIALPCFSLGHRTSTTLSESRHRGDERYEGGPRKRHKTSELSVTLAFVPVDAEVILQVSDINTMSAETGY
jgi:hypothetical protein